MNDLNTRLDLLADEIQTILIAVQECHEEVRNIHVELQQARDELREMRASCGCRRGIPPQVPPPPTSTPIPYPPPVPKVTYSVTEAPVL